ncbi:hypothetical protein CDD83_2593 [Cordyceps sp. RAO-2017]|nr:hypothetical protein CDD83_2593 [Cordyceps sp. RAO-2017]
MGGEGQSSPDRGFGFPERGPFGGRGGSGETGLGRKRAGLAGPRTHGRALGSRRPGWTPVWFGFGLDGCWLPVGEDGEANEVEEDEESSSSSSKQQQQPQEEEEEEEGGGGGGSGGGGPRRMKRRGTCYGPMGRYLACGSRTGYLPDLRRPRRK